MDHHEHGTSRKRRKSFYNSRDSIGFVFRKLDQTEDDTETHEETVSASAVRDSEPSAELLLTESGDVEETVPDETTLQSTPKAMEERLKQFETEFFVRRLMKKWTSLNPDASAKEVEKLREELSEHILASESLWNYYEEESDPEDTDSPEYVQKRVHLMQRETEEWDHTVTSHEDEMETRRSCRASKWTVPPEPATPTSSKKDTQEKIHHIRNVAEALDKEYTRLFEELSQQCDEHEESIARQESDVKVRYDEVATPYTLLSRASRVTAKLQTYN